MCICVCVCVWEYRLRLRLVAFADGEHKARTQQNVLHAYRRQLSDPHSVTVSLSLSPSISLALPVSQLLKCKVQMRVCNSSICQFVPT